MTARILTGSKEEIARKLVTIDGEIREAIVLVDESKDSSPSQTASQDIFAEMEPFTVREKNVDDSRGTIYSRSEDE